MSSTPAFAATPRSAQVIVSAANTARDGSGTLVTLFTAAASRTVADAVTTAASVALTSATAAFTIADTGKPIGGVGIPPGTTIAGFVSATAVLLSSPATATATGVAIVVGASSGSRIDEVRITQIATSPAALGAILWVHNGTSAFYHAEQQFGSATATSTTVKPETYTLTFNNLLLPTGYTLKVTNTVAKDVHYAAFGGDF